MPFQGLSLVKREQAVLAPVSAWLATGQLHAFTVKTYTQAEWDNRQVAAAGRLGANSRETRGELDVSDIDAPPTADCSACPFLETL